MAPASPSLACSMSCEHQRCECSCLSLGDQRQQRKRRHASTPLQQEHARRGRREMNEPKAKPTREASWRDHQQLNFWLWGCLHDGEAYLRSSAEFWGFLRGSKIREAPPNFNQRRIALQDKVELEKYHFVTSLGSLLRELGRARSLFPPIEAVCRQQEHIFAEGKDLRDMIEHAREYEKGGGKHPEEFVREAVGVAECLPGDRPGTADATSTIVDNNGHWLGGRFSVERALVEIRAIQEVAAKRPPPTPTNRPPRVRPPDQGEN